MIVEGWALGVAPGSRVTFSLVHAEKTLAGDAVMDEGAHGRRWRFTIGDVPAGSSVLRVALRDSSGEAVAQRLVRVSRNDAVRVRAAAVTPDVLYGSDEDSVEARVTLGAIPPEPLTAVLKDAGGAIRWEAPLAAGRASHVLRIRGAGLRPGRYELGVRSTSTTVDGLAELRVVTLPPPRMSSVVDETTARLEKLSRGLSRASKREDFEAFFRAALEDPIVASVDGGFDGFSVALTTGRRIAFGVGRPDTRALTPATAAVLAPEYREFQKGGGEASMDVLELLDDAPRPISADPGCLNGFCTLGVTEQALAGRGVLYVSAHGLLMNLNYLCFPHNPGFASCPKGWTCAPGRPRGYPERKNLICAPDLERPDGEICPSGAVCPPYFGCAKGHGVCVREDDGHVAELVTVILSMKDPEQVDARAAAQRLKLMDSREIVQLSGTSDGITRHGFTHHWVRSVGGDFRGSIVYVDTCYGGATPDLFTAFLERGADAYLGWSGPVYSTVAADAARQLFRCMRRSDCEEGGNTVGSCYAPILDHVPTGTFGCRAGSQDRARGDVGSCEPITRETPIQIDEPFITHSVLVGDGNARLH